MKRRATLAMVTLIVATSARAATVAQTLAPGPVQRDETAAIRIDGSNGVLPLANALVRAFAERVTGPPVSVGTGLGSKARIDALVSGAIDVALASHGLDFAVLAARGLVAHRIALTPVVFAVHAGVPRRALTTLELCDIYAGKTQNWATSRDSSHTVKPFLRPEAEVDTEVVRAGIPCMKDLTLSPAVTLAETTGDMLQALQGTPGALGVTTATVVRQSKGALRWLSIDGVEPTPANVTSGRYPLARPAYFVTLSTPPPAVVRFLGFVRSDRGAAVLLENGALPVPNR